MRKLMKFSRVCWAGKCDENSDNSENYEIVLNFEQSTSLVGIKL